MAVSAYEDYTGRWAPALRCTSPLRLCIVCAISQATTGYARVIVFSHELFSIQNYGGVTRCMVELMRALHSRQADWLVWAGRHGSEPLEAFRQEPGVEAHVIAKPAGSLPGRLHASVPNEWGFRRFLRAQGKGIVHRTQYAICDMVPRGYAKVSTLHDMWTEREDASLDERVRSAFKRRALEASDAIICVSEYSRQALTEVWPHLADKAVTIHHGVRPVSSNLLLAREPSPYFLFVGARELRKNFPILLRALEITPTLKSFHLLCVGGGPFTDEEARLIVDSGLGDQVYQRAATDDELAGLYEAAVALLYPSTFEGFGMPLLEGMLHGCPVISSPLTCLPEIGGDAAIYASASHPEAWGNAMESLAFDAVAGAGARERGRERALHFSWAKSAECHSEVYASLS